MGIASLFDPDFEPVAEVPIDPVKGQLCTLGIRLSFDCYGHRILTAENHQL